MRDADVQQQWDMTSSDIDDESEKNILLKKIVTIWVMMRGFSLASSWLGKYKQAKCVATKKKKGLRKTLSRASDFS